MRLSSYLFILLLGILTAQASETWKPDPSEILDVNDPRIAAQDSYRMALAAVRVQTYLLERLKTPGDQEDLLVTEFQESISGRQVTLATEYLKEYPEKNVATELLLFQINHTSGIWPPWKRLALALFDKCPNEVDAVLPTLSREKREKFLSDVEFGLRMSTEPHAIMFYPITNDLKTRISSAVARFKTGNPQPSEH